MALKAKCVVIIETTVYEWVENSLSEKRMHSSDVVASKVPYNVAKATLNSVQGRADSEGVKLENIEASSGGRRVSTAYLTYDTVLEDGREFHTRHKFSRELLMNTQWGANMLALWGVTTNDEPKADSE